MKIRDKAVVEVHGFVMLHGVEEGKYRIEAGTYYGSPSYRFFRSKGKKILAHHYASSVDPWIKDKNNEDLNKIVIL